MDYVSCRNSVKLIRKTTTQLFMIIFYKNNSCPRLSNVSIQRCYCNNCAYLSTLILISILNSSKYTKFLKEFTRLFQRWLEYMYLCIKHVIVYIPINDRQQKNMKTGCLTWWTFDIYLHCWRRILEC